MSPIASKNVAVIGGGAAGLIAAHELRQEGHKVVVFERENQVGGTWAYTPTTESDPLGLDPTRIVIHSTLYASLRTNLPREVMGFRAYPFLHKKGSHRDQRRFPVHKEILEYLKDFAGDFGLYELVRFGTEVWQVGLMENGKWKVKSRKRDGNGNNDNDQEKLDEVYDAVVVCNGHHTEPRPAEIPGIEGWPGKQIHSHNNRVPEPFRDKGMQLVLMISRERFLKLLKKFHIASRSVQNDIVGKLAGYDNIWLHSMIESVLGDGSVAFLEGSVVCADIILHCTGYKHHFPFLETNGIVTVDENRVGPLYKHIFHQP